MANRCRTKGRFLVDVPTDGNLNRTDMVWAMKANP